MELKNPLQAPDFVHAVTIETVAPRLQLFTFPDGFQCYSPSGVEETELIYNEIVVKQEYLQTDIGLEEAGCVLDVGANIGVFTLFVKSVNPAAEVYTFEPMPENYAALLRNVELHGLEGVHPFNIALGSADQIEKQFTYYPNMTGNSTSRPDRKGRQREVFLVLFGEEMTNYFFEAQSRVVQMRTLSAVMAAEHITHVDLLKIDVEGDEVEILQGMDNDQSRVIQQIVLEVHGEQSLQECQARLRELGYQVWLDTEIATGSVNAQMYATRATAAE